MMPEMKQDTRRLLRLVWEMSGVDESRLSHENRVLLEAMRMHPQYYDLWARLDEVTDEELERDGSNPIAHVMIHHTLENQLAMSNPPEVTQTLNRLMKQGKTRHEALHEIGVILSEEIFAILKDNRPYNAQRYITKLNRLGQSKGQSKQKSKRKR